jgi:hypothetical protein
VEEISLINTGQEPANLTGWIIRSATSSRKIALDQVLAAGQTAILSTNRFLTNTGGTYELVNESGVVVDRLTYPAVAEATTVTRSPQSVVWNVVAPPVITTTVTLTATVVRHNAQSLNVSLADGEKIKITTRGILLPKLVKGTRILLIALTKQIGRTGIVWIMTESSRLLILAQPAVKAKKRSTTRTSVVTVPALVVFRPQHSQLRRRPPPSGLSSSMRSLTIDTFALWSLAILLSLGVVLSLPRLRQKSV